MTGKRASKIRLVSSYYTYPRHRLLSERCERSAARREGGAEGIPDDPEPIAVVRLDGIPQDRIVVIA